LRGFAAVAFAAVDFFFVLVFDPVDELGGVGSTITDGCAGSDVGVVELLDVLGEGLVGFEGSKGCS